MLCASRTTRPTPTVRSNTSRRRLLLRASNHEHAVAHAQLERSRRVEPECVEELAIHDHREALPDARESLPSHARLCLVSVPTARDKGRRSVLCLVNAMGRKVSVRQRLRGNCLGLGAGGRRASRATQARVPTARRAGRERGARRRACAPAGAESGHPDSSRACVCRSRRSCRTASESGHPDSSRARVCRSRRSTTLPHRRGGQRRRRCRTRPPARRRARRRRRRPRLRHTRPHSRSSLHRRAWHRRGRD